MQVCIFEPFVFTRDPLIWDQLVSKMPKPRLCRKPHGSCQGHILMVLSLSIVLRLKKRLGIFRCLCYKEVNESRRQAGASEIPRLLWLKAVFSLDMLLAGSLSGMRIILWFMGWEISLSWSLFENRFCNFPMGTSQQSQTPLSNSYWGSVLPIFLGPLLGGYYFSTGNVDKRWPKDMNGYFSRDELQMAKRHMKRCSESRHQGNGNKNHNTVLPHPSYNPYHPKTQN